jgi:hypothetical protein
VRRSWARRLARHEADVDELLRYLDDAGSHGSCPFPPRLTLSRNSPSPIAKSVHMRIRFVAFPAPFASLSRPTAATARPMRTRRSSMSRRSSSSSLPVALTCPVSPDHFVS